MFLPFLHLATFYVLTEHAKVAFATLTFFTNAFWGHADAVPMLIERVRSPK